jgi:hypothetical protein
LSSSSPAVGGFLQIPSGLSTPRAPQATAATGSGSCNLTSAGANGFLRVLTTGFGWWKILRGPLQAGRAGGLLELTHRAASSLFSLRVWLICLKIAFRLHFSQSQNGFEKRIQTAFSTEPSMEKCSLNRFTTFD